MTVVIAQHFFQGLVVIADSRASMQDGSSFQPWRDNTQKLYFLSPSIIIGFAGDIEFAGEIIGFLMREIKKDKRLEQLNFFVLKGPKLIRYAYKSLSKQAGKGRSVSFIIAGLDFGRPAEARDATGKITGRLALFDKKIFKADYPDFIPKYVTVQNPFVVIGSGEIGVKGLEEDFAKMQFGSILPTLDFYAAIIEHSLREKLKQLGVDSVGGLSQIAVIDNSGPRFIPYVGKRNVWDPGEPDQQMSIEQGRFYQTDLTTGKRIKLLYPPEVIEEFKVDGTESELFAILNET